MDILDVSGFPEYTQLLRQQKRTLANAQSVKGLPFRAKESRDELIARFMLHRMSCKAPPGYSTWQSSFVPPAYAPCIASLDDLQKVMINDLTLETHHRGSYVLLRAMTPTTIMTAIMVIAEDENGNVVVLQLYNQGKELAEDGRLVEGTIVLVKEPYLKVLSDGGYGIRVDHLSDVKFLPEYDSLVPVAWGRKGKSLDGSANDWKTKGNKSFKRTDYHRAVEQYSKALASNPTKEEALTIRINRALAFLKTSQYDAALRDLDMEPSGLKASEKTLFRKAQALYHLQRFREACDVYAELRKEYPGNTTAKKEFNRALERLAEQENGKYQFKRLQLEAKTSCPPHLDHTTYIGPVAVRGTETHGRGLFTTKAVKAGDLLLCEKAFAHAFHDPNDPTQGLALLINLQTESMTMGTQAELIRLIVQKLYKSLSLMSTITGLYHGSYEAVDVQEADGMPVVDTFLAERVVTFNCFGCPLSTREFHVRAMEDKVNPNDNDEKFSSSGIWPLASHINHSCNSNARRSFIGDMMIIRATQDLDPNTEITFEYQTPRFSQSQEKPMSLQHWGFDCDCKICQDLQKIKKSALIKRQWLKDGLTKAFQCKKPKMGKIEAMLSELADTYSQPASEIPRIGMWKAYFTLSTIYAEHNQPQEAVDSAIRALESLGYIIEGGRLPHTPGTPLLVRKWGLMDDGLAGCWMALSFAYHSLRLPELEGQAKNYARLAYRICVGEDETFDQTYK